MSAGYTGLVLHGEDFLMPVERDLLRAVLLDVDGGGALRMPVDAPVRPVSVDELSGLSDAGLIGRFNEYVDALLGADWLVQVYDVCRPEVRALLSDAPVADLRYWRARHGTSMADEDVERAVRCLLGAGLFGLLEGGCVPVDAGVALMLVRAMLGVRSSRESAHLDMAVRVFRDAWIDLVLSFPVEERAFLVSTALEDIAVALAHAVLAMQGKGCEL